MKKFLSDVLVDCNLTVSGSTTLGAATGVTVANSDDSTKLATTAWVKNLGYVSTNTTYDLSVPSGTTDIRLTSSGGVNDDVTISAAGASTVSRVSDSEIRITSTDTIDYVNSVSLVGSDLTFTGVGNGFAGAIDLSGITSSFNAEEVQTVYENIKNVSGSPIQKGTPLAVVSGQTSGNLSDVVPAAADDPARMPAVFIANEDLADQAEGLGVVYGNITGIDTSAFDSGTTVYVAPGGGWTDTKPTGTNLIQNLGVITKSHDTNGGGVVMGAGRSNDVPNIPNGHAWVGNGSGVATPTLLGTAAYESASTFALANHNHDDRYYTQTELDTEFNKYLRSDIPDSFNKLINSSLNITPEWGGGAINLKPSVAGGSTGIVFTSAQNINTDNGKDHGYLWWYDNNNNYSLNPGSQENGAVILGVMNDSVENGMGDSAVVESSGNIFLNPGIDPTEGSQGGNSGPDFTRGRVYVGRAEQYFEVYHEGNFAAFSGDYDDLTNKPTLFSGDYADLTNKPTLFSGNYNDLTNRPTLGTAAAADTTDFAAANHVHDYDNYVSWNLKTNNVQRTTVASGGTLDLVAGDNVSISYGAGGVVTINSTDTNTNTNDYVDSLSFSTSTGVLTIGRTGSLDDLTADLDGRYTLTSHTHDTRYIRKQISDTFTQLVNRSYNTTLAVDRGAIVLEPGVAGGATGIGFVSNQNENSDFGYLWWYDDNNNYSFGSGSEENAVLVLGIQNDSSTTAFGGTQDAVAIESSSNIFLNPGVELGEEGGASGPNFTNGKVYIGTSANANEVYHEGNLINVSQLTNDAGYITSYSETDTLDSVTSRGASTSNNVQVGNLKSTGSLTINNDDATTIKGGSGVGDPVAQVIASFDPDINIGAFIDFTIYNDTKEHMRSGTLQLVFNRDEVMFNEVSTMNIGDTEPCILLATVGAGIINVTYETPDPSFYIKYQVRTL